MMFDGGHNFVFSHLSLLCLQMGIYMLHLVKARGPILAGLSC